MSWFKSLAPAIKAAAAAAADDHFARTARFIFTPTHVRTRAIGARTFIFRLEKVDTFSTVALRRYGGR